MELVPKVFLDSFVVTMVAYTVSISMAFILAQKAAYEVDANQELLAQVNTVIASEGDFQSLFAFLLIGANQN